MKMPVGVILIVLSTCFTIGLVYIVVENTEKINARIPNLHAQKSDEKNEENVKREENKQVAVSLKDLMKKEQNEQNQAAIDMSDEDKDLINSIANLDDEQLFSQMKSLRDMAKEQRLGEALELEGSDEKTILHAKKTLERIALMGLESTRRKFVHLEPELKDPLFAHRDSLKEIREALDD